MISRDDSDHVSKSMPTPYGVDTGDPSFLLENDVSVLMERQVRDSVGSRILSLSEDSSSIAKNTSSLAFPVVLIKSLFSLLVVLRSISFEKEVFYSSNEESQLVFTVTVSEQCPLGDCLLSSRMSSNVNCIEAI